MSTEHESSSPMSDAYWLEVADRRVEELEAAGVRYRQALSKIARGPNSAPFSEPWSRAEALIALSGVRASGQRGAEAS